MILLMWTTYVDSNRSNGSVSPLQDDLFDKLTTTALNNHLKQQMEKLTAKVFRTYNASYTLQKLLDQTPSDMGSVEEKVRIVLSYITSSIILTLSKVLHYNRCNREVAILCNHQRSLPKVANTNNLYLSYHATHSIVDVHRANGEVG